MAQTLQGLSEREALARRERGQANTIQLQTGPTYLQIVRKNAFTFINTILFAIGIVLISLGPLGDAVVTAGLVLLNVIVGVYQEGRAKRKLDQIALLTRPKAAVIRDGAEKSLDPGEITLGDLLVARPGDQIFDPGPPIRRHSDPGHRCLGSAGSPTQECRAIDEPFHLSGGFYRFDGGTACLPGLSGHDRRSADSPLFERLLSLEPSAGWAPCPQD